MNRKRIVAMLVVVAILCLLIWLQVRAWRQFDWHTFWLETENVNPWGVLASAALTYFCYYLRAVRWRLFLKPVCETSTARLVAPQFIGFAALALLGRAGEVIRPYLIAKKENLTFTSQMGVWTVERIFDMGSFALLLALSFLSPDLRSMHFYARLRIAALVLVALVAGMVVVAVVLRLSGEPVANFLHRKLSGSMPHVAKHVREKILSFSSGLHTIHDFSSALQITAVSVLMWLLIAFAYLFLTHAYLGRLHDLGLASMIVLMGAAMVGSMLQLPAVGGGSQLATINMLSAGFGISPEMSTSCGMLIWAVTFMSVTPTGLLLAHRERISLRTVAEAEQKEEAALAE